MKRDFYPEKVPFRLTRMLIKAMEACGIEGTYRYTCEIVMRVLRENSQSLMAILYVSLIFKTILLKYFKNNITLGFFIWSFVELEIIKIWWDKLT